MIAITIEEENINSKINDCFGKSEYFIIIDSKNKKYKFFRNPGSEDENFSGVKAAKFLINKGVNTVFSNNFGIKVKRIFDRNKVQLVLLSDRFTNLSTIPSLKEILQNLTDHTLN